MLKRAAPKNSKLGSLGLITIIVIGTILLPMGSKASNTQKHSRGRGDSLAKRIESVNEFDDVRSEDLSKLDLSSTKGLITTLEFNRETLWPTPDRLPEGLDPKMLLQEGMNPGLGVRALHARGITGAGVHVGLIDQPLLLDHPEYAGKIVAYHHDGFEPHKSSMHCPAMASVLVGKQCGTAPDAKLHIVAVPSWKADASHYARALDRLVTYNENARKDQRIRVVSVSAQPSGEGSEHKNQSLWDQAVRRAKAKGILVLDGTWRHGFVSLCWLDPQNRESVEACTPGFRNGPVEADAGHIHVPTQPRTVAEAYEGKSFGYAYGGGSRRSRRLMAKNGYSATIPYAAGVLALGWQIRPDLTPAQIKKLLFASAHVHESGAKIIHPAAFIDLIRKQGDNQHAQSPGSITFPKIDRRPRADDEDLRVLKRLPKYDPDSDNSSKVSLQCCDLSKLDLRNSIEVLMHARFDDRTVWPPPDRMPSDFDWHKIMELGKDPGLGVRSLHKKGITGRGVRVAIIDQPLLVDHQEYAERVRLYEEIDLQGRTRSSGHGVAVASIAVGKTAGVAPEAELYYIAQYNIDWDKGTGTLRTLARGIHRIVEINEQLPKDNKIRVISISKGWSQSNKDYEVITQAVQKARAAGMLIVCTSMQFVHEGCDFDALGRSPLADPDVFESYIPGWFRVESFWADQSSPSEGFFWVPMDSRATGSSTDNNEYVFYRTGGFSWAVPYIAGVYALAVQVDPAITPERFWALAARTGRTIELERNGKRKPLGPIVDPVRLIRSIEAGESFEVKQRQSDCQYVQTDRRPQPETATIVPGVRVGDYTVGMSKDDVLKKLGKPDIIYAGGEECSLDDLPRQYVMAFGDLSFLIDYRSVEEVWVRSPLYKLTNGLGVGDSEEKIKQAFGDDFQLQESKWKDFLNYEDKGIQFEIHKKNRRVMQIGVF